MKHGFTAHELPPWVQGYLLPFHVLRIMVALFCLIGKIRPDLIHAITLKYCFMAGVPARLRRHKIVHTIAGRGYLFSAEYCRSNIMRMAVAPFLMAALRSSLAQVLFQNSDDRDLMIRKNYVRPPQCHLVAGSGVDTAAFTPAPKPPDDDITIGMATRLVREKGVDVFIEAARILKKRGVPARFILAGAPSPSNPATITAAEMETMVAGDAVQWLGKVADMQKFYADCHVIAYPSYYCEGVPKVLLEAAASGRAIVTTDHPGCRDAVKHNENGLLVPIKNPRETANAIERLINDPALRARMGQKGREMAENKFDVNFIIAKTLLVYDKTLKL